jgi:ribosomal protein S18 acetylase RimI-like enzyme
MNNTTIEIVAADLAVPSHQAAIVAMTDAYCRDPLANGRPLADDVFDRLITGLRAYDPAYRVILLAFDGERPVGIATCFLGFSTFAARPLLNLHDLSVIPEYRNRGIGRQLLEAVEGVARSRGCCKITLEVMAENPARRLYEAVGFTRPDYENDAGELFFLAKRL